MKTFAIKGLLGGAALLFAGIGYASAADIVIVPEHQTIIREYVDKNGQPVTVTERVTVGTVVPREIQIVPFPKSMFVQVPEAEKYDFVRWGDQVVLVDPESRKVVAILD